MKNDKKSPIAFYIPALNGGGAQKVVVNLANALVELTDRPIHIVLARAEGEFLDEVRAEVRIIDLGKGRASRAILALAGYLRQVRPAVLCSSLNYANVCAATAWHLAGRPCRLVLREDEMLKTPGGGLRSCIRTFVTQSLMRLLYPHAAAVVAISDAVARSLSERNICLKEKIRVIGNPISITEGHDAASGRMRSYGFMEGKFICAIGRLSKEKGFDLLLESFAKLSDRNIRLVLLGEGELRHDLLAQAEHLGIADRVHIPGFVAAPEHILSRASLFVLSSRSEGFGNVLVEALATGVPIVSTDCPGAPRVLLCDGTLGHLVPLDDAEALAEAICGALASPRGTREERLNRAKDFAAPVISRQYLDVFRLSPDK